MQTNANKPETLGVPELPEGWVPPFSLEISMHDGKCYMKGKDGKPLDFDHDMDGNQLVIGGDIEPMEAIEYSLNAVYGENSLRDQLAKLTAENERLKADITHAVKEAKKRDPDYPWTQETASEAVWALGEGKLGIEAACDDWQKQLTAERDAAVAEVGRLKKQFNAMCKLAYNQTVREEELTNAN